MREYSKNTLEIHVKYVFLKVIENTSKYGNEIRILYKIAWVGGWGAPKNDVPWNTVEYTRDTLKYTPKYTRNTAWSEYMRIRSRIQPKRPRIHLGIQRVQNTVEYAVEYSGNT